MNKTKIEWCDSTWNPVTGCKHGCEYCYARRIAKRFRGYEGYGCEEDWEAIEKGQYVLTQPAYIKRGMDEKITKAPFPFDFEPTFHRYRLDEPQKRRDPQTIFVCSMADLFGEWVPNRWIDEVFAACRQAPQHRYLFLTKNPARYMALAKGGKLPEEENFWYGSTATSPDMEFWWSDHHNTFVSIEPMLGPFPSNNGAAVKKVDWIIMGAMTGPGSAKYQPEREWVSSLVQDADAAGVPVFMKDSLIPIVNEVIWRRSLPWEVWE